MQHSERETGYEVNVTFDGKEIPMVPFVKEVLAMLFWELQRPCGLY